MKPEETADWLRHQLFKRTISPCSICGGVGHRFNDFNYLTECYLCV